MIIEIIAAPTSALAPKHIREAWVGVKMAATPDTGTGKWHGNQNAGGYVVSGNAAVNALIEAGKYEAAAFWRSPAPPVELRFGAEYCRVVSE